MTIKATENNTILLSYWILRETNSNDLILKINDKNPNYQYLEIKLEEQYVLFRNYYNKTGNAS